MINKEDLVGKYILFLDKDEKMRTQKVIKRDGNWFTVKNAVGKKTRVYKDKIIGRQYPKRGIERIKW